MTIPPPSTDYHLFHDDLPAPRTRPDYHRFFLDPRTLPSTKIVGVLACQRDSYLRALNTEVIDARKAGEDALLRASGVTAQDANAPGGDKKAGKAGKKEKGKEAKASVAAVQKEGPELWESELKDTVLFAEGKLSAKMSCALSDPQRNIIGGGQPNDTGTLVLLPPTGSPISLVVRDVFRRGLTAIHVVELPMDHEGKEAAKAALRHGTPCETRVDWERRYDQVR
jgi:hypothetical protein